MLNDGMGSFFCLNTRGILPVAYIYPGSATGVGGPNSVLTGGVPHPRQGPCSHLKKPTPFKTCTV